MISRRILAAVALLCAFTVAAHAQTGSPKTSAQLNAEINARVTTNGKQQITAFDLRQIWLDLVSSIMPDTAVVSGNFPSFDGVTGKLKDSGFSFSTNLQTANYTIATTDCGKTIQAGTGATGQFTLTLPSVSGFPANCSVAIKNGDTTRGKVLAGFPAGFASAQNVLWPLQYGTVRIINGAWAAGVAPGRWIQTTNTALQANHSSGSNTNNDCLGTGTGACATAIHAFEVFKTAVIVPGDTSPTIQTDCGFTENPSGAFIGSVGSGTGVLFIIGNEASPANCVLNTTGMSFDDGNVTSLRGFTLRSSGTAAFVQKGGTLVFANVICGANTGSCFQVNEGGSLTWDPGTLAFGEISCAPNCFAFGIVNNGGTVSLQQASITMPSVLTFVTLYSGNFSGSRGFIGTTFSGPGSGVASTGTQYIISNSATLALSATVMPGNTAGVLSSNACLEGVCAKISNLMFPSPIAFSTLPACSATTEGAQQTVADSTSNTWGATAAGLGAFRVLLYCNGTNWTVAGK